LAARAACWSSSAACSPAASRCTSASMLMGPGRGMTRNLLLESLGGSCCPTLPWHGCACCSATTLQRLCGLLKGQFAAPPRFVLNTARDRGGDPA
jgi:hypothetical protein